MLGSFPIPLHQSPSYGQANKNAASCEGGVSMNTLTYFQTDITFFPSCAHRPFRLGCRIKVITKLETVLYMLQEHATILQQKVKVKLSHPYHEGPLGLERHSSSLTQPWHQMDVSGQYHALTALLWGNNCCYPLERRLGGPRSQSACFGEERNFVPVPRMYEP